MDKNLNNLEKKAEIIKTDGFLEVGPKEQEQKSELALYYYIFLTAEFLEFLDKFCEKKERPDCWETDYRTLLTACKFWARDQHKFKELVRKTENFDEFKIAFTFRD